MKATYGTALMLAANIKYGEFKESNPVPSRKEALRLIKKERDMYCYRWVFGEQCIIILEAVK